MNRANMDRIIEEMTFDTFTELAEQFPAVPVYRRIGSDFYTPQLAFLRFRRTGQAAFLFESAIRGEQVGRYSFVGFNPSEVLAHTVTPSPNKMPNGSSFFQQIKERLAATSAPVLPELPPLTGGWIGYLGYDLVREIEHLPDAPPDHTGIPDSVLGQFTAVIAFDHLKNEVWLIYTVLRNGTDIAACYREAIRELDAMHRTLQTAPLHLESFTAYTSRLEGNFSEDAFRKAVKTAKEYIYAGDAFQIVLSQRFRIPFEGDSFQIYRALRSLNPSPYMFYLQFPQLELIGASPEMLVRQQQDTVQVVPIAGTRWRGKTDAEDDAIARELLEDPKEIAEHMMLVDLARNDVGRVSQPGTVTVRDFRTVERYSHVMHIISRVYGQLQPHRSPVDTFRAVFPAGTVSGAPKIRAMEIIDELEPERRNFYAGGVGYFNFNGEMDHCIAIRTVLAHNNTLHLQAGAGIVADSVPEKEYQETLNKAMALRKAIELATEEEA